ncbi:MAG: NUDIX domain-containing protein [Deltaproteobacteria bacterium]|nr:NUDIX domain-containing protein [Deltaproteobacteria bacterium]
MADFNKVGFLVFDEKQRILMCRKDHFTSRLILPGGRIENEESDMECLERELSEELGDVTAKQIEFVGQYEDIAHSDDSDIHKTLEIRLYSGTLQGRPAPSGEICELIWFGKDEDPELLTPIVTDKILPDLRSRKIINW